MQNSVELQILKKVKKTKKGSLFFTENFSMYGKASALRKALERLVKSGQIERLAFGIYYRPAYSKAIGKLTPSIEEVAFAIAKRDKAKILPTGAYALNRLGLSAQVQMNIVYLTDGSARKVKIGNQTILFKKVSPKSIAVTGEISGLAIQALKEIGREKVLDKEIKHIQQLLKNEKTTRLEHDFRLAPMWIKEIIKPILKEIKGEQK